MRITQWGEYGIQCALLIAKHEAGGTETVSAAVIAEDLGIAIQYAQQILLRLKRGGVVDSIRGPQGGYRLTRTPTEISLYDILHATEGATFEVICENRPIHADCAAADHLCELKPVWRELREYVDSFFRQRSLAMLLERSAQPAAPILIGQQH